MSLFRLTRMYPPLSVLQGLLVFNFLDLKRLSYGTYQFPAWADALGWLIVAGEVGCIPAVAIYRIVTSGHRGSLLQVRRHVVTRRSAHFTFTRVSLVFVDPVSY